VSRFHWGDASVADRDSEEVVLAILNRCVSCKSRSPSVPGWLFVHEALGDGGPASTPVPEPRTVASSGKLLRIDVESGAILTLSPRLTHSSRIPATGLKSGSRPGTLGDSPLTAQRRSFIADVGGRSGKRSIFSRG
jgi:hypothetical protein